MCYFFRAGALTHIKQTFSHLTSSLLNFALHFVQRLHQKGHDSRAYYHELFLRGRFELCQLMKRLVKPGRRIADVHREPNFYEIAKAYPLLEGSKEKEETDVNGEEDEKEDRKPSDHQAKEGGDASSAPSSMHAQVPRLMAQLGMQTSQGNVSHGLHGAARQHVDMMFNHNAACMNSPMLASFHTSNWPSFDQPLPSVCQHCLSAYLSCGGHQIVSPFPQGFVNHHPYHDHALQYQSTVHHPRAIDVTSRLDDAYNRGLQFFFRETRHHKDNLAAVASVASIDMDEHKADLSDEAPKHLLQEEMAAQSSECNVGEEAETEGTQFMVESLGDKKSEQEKDMIPSFDLLIDAISHTEDQEHANDDFYQHAMERDAIKTSDIFKC